MIASICFVGPCPRARADNPVSAAMRLSGGVEHSDSLDPLPEDERIGAIVAPMQASSSSSSSSSSSITGSQATVVPSLGQRHKPKQIIAPTFTQPNQARNQQQQPQAVLPPTQLRSANPHFDYHPPVPAAHMPASASQMQRTQSPQYQQLLQAQQHRQQGQQLQQADRYKQIDKAEQSPQANMQLLRQLNAHVNTQGSPQAPRFQVMPPVQQSTGRNSFLQARAQVARLDPAAIYKKNLQAIAAMDLSHTGRNQILQAKALSNGPSVKVEVPFWLAGEWQRSTTNEESRIELPSGKALKAVGRQKAVVTDVFGMYKDKTGKVWMVVPLHNHGSIDRGIAIDRHQVNKYELILTGKTSALIKVVASHSIIDKATHKVIQAYQDEELNAYSLVQDGLVKTDSSVKVFDQMGHAKLLTRAVSMEKRVRKL